MRPDLSGPNSKSQYPGTTKIPKCNRCGLVYPLSWTRIQSDEHDKNCEKQTKLF